MNFEAKHSWDAFEDVVNARLANEKPLRAVMKRMAALDSFLKERIANKYPCFLKTRTIHFTFVLARVLPIALASFPKTHHLR